MKAATLYARRGWRVVPLHNARPDGTCTCEPREDGKPCKSQGKHPRLKEWTAEASSDPEQIAAWVRAWPDANVGIATGAASGFFVLDVDPDHGGAETLAALVEEHGELPVTPQAVTGSGGAHYLFKMPAHAVTTTAGKLGRGLDIRGDGGQIVAAPSRSAKGPYRWVRPPWETELAEAPAWIFARLARGPSSTKGPNEGLRGYFPAASDEVLDAAREALAVFGPGPARVDGEGGGTHTVQACALLTHDFALSDDEAWPLLLEWNGTRTPPWDLDELRERLRRGRKYGKAEYGAKRSMDTVETARKAITDWQTAGGANPIALIELVRPLAALCADPARHAIIQQELTAATGVKARALALPKPKPAPVPLKQGEIKVSTDLHRVADDSIRLMGPRVFARNGVLCEVVRAERTFIHDLEPARVLDLMSQSAIYVRNDENKGLVTQAAPAPVASILHARRTHAGIRVLEAVTTAPVFLADGSILQERGYSAQARVYLEPNVHVDVPEEPTLADARAAVAVFRDLLCDFRFASEADFSSWLAALLSPLVKAATGNAPSPLVCISASSPGAGKTLLTEVIARIVTGAGAEVRPYNPKDASEWGKRLTAFVKAAAPVSVFDNVNGAIGDEGLDRLITSGTWSDRQLGASEAPPLPNVTTWLATGNNIEPIGDTVRRVLMVRIEVMTERPQERTGFKRAALTDYALEQRAELLSAALTILRAFHVAGRPVQQLPAWGSFTAWSELVRGALVWAGVADPFVTQQRAAAEMNEPENDAHDFWLDVVSQTDGLAGSIVLLANQRDAQGVLGAREPLTPLYLRRFINRFVDKPRAGKRIRKERDPKRNQVTYFVQAI